jgi:uncharacterized protein YqjF (DUF2071 family)
MELHRDKDDAIRYHSRRTHDGTPEAEFRARYRPTGDATTSSPGSLDSWLTERYCLYAVDDSERVYRAEIHHRPWSLRPALMEIDVNTMATAASIVLPAAPPRVSYAHRLDVVVWLPQLVDHSAEAPVVHDG